MAITPRPVTSSVPANTPSVRQVAGSRANVATDGLPVEELNPQSNVSFDMAMLFQNHERAGEKKDDTPKGKTLVEFAGTNQTFVNILEESARSSGGREEARAVRRGFSGYVTRAINIYESNAQVIHGSGPDPRGSVLSLIL